MSSERSTPRTSALLEQELAEQDRAFERDGFMMVIDSKFGDLLSPEEVKEFGEAIICLRELMESDEVLSKEPGEFKEEDAAEKILAKVRTFRINERARVAKETKTQLTDEERIRAEELDHLWLVRNKGGQALVAFLRQLVYSNKPKLEALRQAQGPDERRLALEGYFEDSAHEREAGWRTELETAKLFLKELSSEEFLLPVKPMPRVPDTAMLQASRESGGFGFNREYAAGVTPELLTNADLARFFEITDPTEQVAYRNLLGNVNDISTNRFPICRVMGIEEVLREQGEENFSTAEVLGVIRTPKMKDHDKYVPSAHPGLLAYTKLGWDSAGEERNKYVAALASACGVGGDRSVLLVWCGGDVRRLFRGWLGSRWVAHERFLSLRNSLHDELLTT